VHVGHAAPVVAGVDEPGAAIDIDDSTSQVYVTSSTHSQDQASNSPELGSRVLIIAPYASYRISPFVNAAIALKSKVFIASEGRFSLSIPGTSGISVKFDEPGEAIDTLTRVSIAEDISAVIGTDDSSVLLANEIARRLNLPHNDGQSILATRSKDLARKMLGLAGVPIPEFRVLDLDSPLASQIEGIDYPCVVKPVNLSMSRGVIRANNARELLTSCSRVEVILDREAKSANSRKLLVERFISGQEFALEGILYNGVLEVLAIFDKPDLMDGPYFEETYYVTPSRLDSDVQSRLVNTVFDACKAMGLREGPVHAECRINDDSVWVLELAARTIGGMCSRLFEFATGKQLEEIVIYHALGYKIDLPVERPAAGVMMIPTPKPGILRRVEGLSSAKKVKYIDDAVISVREGYELIPSPEGASYLGFIYSTAPTPQEVELALREAYAKLDIVVAPLWKVAVAS